VTGDGITGKDMATDIITLFKYFKENRNTVKVEVK
jgi:hypothetical protein